ncbi:MAG: radical SAM protein, partial [Candidatus Omnitrophica bacterium]|nr:radical SAM protein [Candidatus Omnitrophota bacterium]
MNPSKPPRLLLTSVCRPLGKPHGDGISVGYELLHEQVTRAQGCFSPRSYQLHFSLEYIAHNLDTPTVVLQYPSERELIRELKRGYEYVGVSFILSVFHKMRRVVELIRQYSPQSKIILGGYGTVLDDEELKPYGDFICREEGVAFLRRLLGKPPKSMPYDHPLIINGLQVFSQSIGENGMVFAGLGCPNGCDFCCTSHFFKRRHIRLLPSGRDIFQVLMRYRNHNPAIKFTVLDEDFLLNKRRALELLECVRKANVDLPMFVFSSVKALSQYQICELLEMGISGVWMGYEGRRSNFAKQQGRPIDDLVKDLRSHGINTLTSMIVGFDYQTPEIIQEELNDLLALEPTFTQFLIYGPVPGTPFYQRVIAEGRLRKKFIESRQAFYRRCTGFYNVVQHPTMTTPQLQKIQRQCFQQDFERLGPSIIRSVETWWLGYQTLKDSTNARLRACAQRYRKDILDAIPALRPAMWMGPTTIARERARKMLRTIQEEFGPIRLGTQL